MNSRTAPGLWGGLSDLRLAVWLHVNRDNDKQTGLKPASGIERPLCKSQALAPCSQVAKQSTEALFLLSEDPRGFHLRKQYLYYLDEVPQAGSRNSC